MNGLIHQHSGAERHITHPSHHTLEFELDRRCPAGFLVLAFVMARPRIRRQLPAKLRGAGSATRTPEPVTS